jgi:hypothetical protein
MLIFKRIKISFAINTLVSVTIELWHKFEGLKGLITRWICLLLTFIQYG